MPDPRADLFNLLREDGLDPPIVQALEKLPRSAQARLGSRILELIDRAVSSRLEHPPEATSGKEVWWIYSDKKEPWAGYNIATFVPNAQGFTLVVIHNDLPERTGVRIWEDIREREGWKKIERIPVPRITA